MARIAVYLLAVALMVLTVLWLNPPPWACFFVGVPFGWIALPAGEIAQKWWSERKMWR